MPTFGKTKMTRTCMEIGILRYSDAPLVLCICMLHWMVICEQFSSAKGGPNSQLYKKVGYTTKLFFTVGFTHLFLFYLPNPTVMTSCPKEKKKPNSDDWSLVQSHLGNNGRAHFFIFYFLFLFFIVFYLCNVASHMDLNQCDCIASTFFMGSLAHFM